MRRVDASTDLIRYALDSVMGNSDSNPIRNIDKRTARREYRATFSNAIVDWQLENGIDPATASSTNNSLTRSLNFSEDGLKNVRVLVRKRPIFKHEVDGNEFDVVSCADGNCAIIHDTRMHADMRRMLLCNHSFAFDGVFDQRASNDDVYLSAAKPLVKEAVCGGYATCCVYGQTGSGKSFTMTSIYEKAAYDIFAELESNNDRFMEMPRISLSFFELQGDNVLDLLNVFAPVTLLSAVDGGVHAVPAVEPTVKTPEELVTLIKHALSIRTTAATGVHDSSSRSHAVLRIFIEQNPNLKGSGKHGSLEGCLTLVDLAGSEQSIDSMYHTSDRRKEGAAINSSLMALKDCIRARASGSSATHIYRKSKLTMALKQSFVLSQARTVIIATVSPSSKDTEHSLNTLRHACLMDGQEKDAAGETRFMTGGVKSEFKEVGQVNVSSMAKKNRELKKSGLLEKEISRNQSNGNSFGSDIAPNRGEKKMTDRETAKARRVADKRGLMKMGNDIKALLESHRQNLGAEEQQNYRMRRQSNFTVPPPPAQQNVDDSNDNKNNNNLSVTESYDGSVHSDYSNIERQYQIYDDSRGVTDRSPPRSGDHSPLSPRSPRSPRSSITMLSSRDVDGSTLSHKEQNDAIDRVMELEQFMQDNFDNMEPEAIKDMQRKIMSEMEKIKSGGQNQQRNHISSNSSSNSDSSTRRESLLRPTKAKSNSDKEARRIRHQLEERERRQQRQEYDEDVRDVSREEYEEDEHAWDKDTIDMNRRSPTDFQEKESESCADYKISRPEVSENGEGYMKQYWEEKEKMVSPASNNPSRNPQSPGKRPMQVSMISPDSSTLKKDVAAMSNRNNDPGQNRVSFKKLVISVYGNGSGRNGNAMHRRQLITLMRMHGYTEDEIGELVSPSGLTRKGVLYDSQQKGIQKSKRESYSAGSIREKDAPENHQTERVENSPRSTSTSNIQSKNINNNTNVKPRKSYMSSYGGMSRSDGGRTAEVHNTLQTRETREVDLHSNMNNKYSQRSVARVTGKDRQAGIREAAEQVEKEASLREMRRERARAVMNAKDDSAKNQMRRQNMAKAEAVANNTLSVLDKEAQVREERRLRALEVVKEREEAHKIQALKRLQSKGMNVSLSDEAPEDKEIAKLQRALISARYQPESVQSALKKKMAMLKASKMRRERGEAVDTEHNPTPAQDNQQVESRDERPGSANSAGRLNISRSIYSRESASQRRQSRKTSSNTDNNSDHMEAGDSWGEENMYMGKAKLSREEQLDAMEASYQSRNGPSRKPVVARGKQPAAQSRLPDKVRTLVETESANHTASPHANQTNSTMSPGRSKLSVHSQGRPSSRGGTQKIGAAAAPWGNSYNETDRE